MGGGFGRVHIIPQAPQEKKSFCALSMLVRRIHRPIRRLPQRGQMERVGPPGLTECGMGEERHGVARTCGSFFNASSSALSFATSLSSR